LDLLFFCRFSGGATAIANHALYYHITMN
jgi:hypothetical protein